MAVPSFNIAPGESAEAVALKRKLALELMKGGMDTSPVQHWTQGAARMLQGALGGYDLYKADQGEKEETGKGNALLAQLFQGGGASPAAAAPSAPSAPVGNSAGAIASIESGGKYDALGPVIKAGGMAGDRAYGKYQVMGSNVGPWSKEALGQEVTPQQFLADPKLQDAVFQHRFGQYEKKYGPEGASRAWFAGEGGMNDLGRKDQLGTTVGAYGQKFAQALGQPQQAAPQQAPQAAPGVPNRDAIIQMLGNRKTAPIAQGIISNQIQQQFKPETTDEIKEYNLYSKQEAAAGRQPKSFFDFKSDLKKAGAINNNVNVGGGSDKQIFDSVDASTNAARTAASGLSGIREARAAMQGGMITGAGADQILGLQKIGAALGVSNSDKITNTETFRAAIAPQVAAMIKATVGTTNISNTDREFAEKAAGGNITLDERSISRLLDIMERAGSGIVTQHQKRLEKVYPDAEKYARERALFSVDLPDAPTITPQTAPAAPDRSAIEQEMRRRGLLK